MQLKKFNTKFAMKGKVKILQVKQRDQNVFGILVNYFSSFKNNKNKNKICISSVFKMTAKHILLYDTVVIIPKVMVI